MKVLWTSNILLPPFAKAIGLGVGWGGSWMTALAERMSCCCPQITLGVFTMHPAGGAAAHVIGGVSHFLLPCRKSDLLGRPGTNVSRAFEKVVADFAPDLIHVHGSEYSYGLLTSEIAPDTPKVLEIQGLIGEYEKYYWSGMSLRDLIRWRTCRDWIRLDGLLEQRWKWRRRARMEAEIFRRTRHVVGRTAWDRAHAWELNPNAEYHHCDEMLRGPFHAAHWRAAAARRHTILTTSSLYPIKGFHVLLAAVQLLKRDFPDVQVRVAGSTFNYAAARRPLGERLRTPGYSRFILDRIRRYGLKDNVAPLGPLDAEPLAAELARAHVYVLPSFIENSPNSLAEAMLVGTPSVAAYAGGVPSMARDGVEVLFHPPGDAAVLAEQIRRVFEDDGLAEALSGCARRRAALRHAPERVLGEVLAVYEMVTGRQASGAAPQVCNRGVAA